MVIRSLGGVPIRLTVGDDRHVSFEVDGVERVMMTSKFLIVPYREVSREDGFILTAYLTSRPSSSRSVVWKR